MLRQELCFQGKPTRLQVGDVIRFLDGCVFIERTVGKQTERLRDRYGVMTLLSAPWMHKFRCEEKMEFARFIAAGHGYGVLMADFSPNAWRLVS